MEEGETVAIEGHELELLANRPVAFPLFTATDRSGEHAGDADRASRRTRFTALPPIRTVLRFGRKLEERALPVQLESQLTEIGTLELWCRSRTTEHRWRLEFRLRDTVGAEAPPPEAAAALVVDPARRRGRDARCCAAAFAGADDPVTLDAPARDRARRRSRRVAAAGDPRAVGRALDARAGARARAPEHEARWLNLAGFLLRPGFGDPGDDLRVNRLWRVLGADLRHPRATQCRAEWWNLWKRVAGGLSARQQQHLLQQVSPALLRKGKTKGPRPGPQELREMWQADRQLRALAVVAACRARPTRWSPRPCAAAPPSRSCGRWRASRHACRSTGRSTAWCRASARPRPSSACWASRVATPGRLRLRARPDRARLRRSRARSRCRRSASASPRRLETLPDGARLARIVREPVALEAREEARLLDESLPAGLRLRE